MTETSLIRAVVPMIHVADVERSIEFYRLLGFEVGNKVPSSGPLHWAWLYAPAADDWKRGPNLMVTRSEGPVNADADAVLFYLYAPDLEGLRGALISEGLTASEISHPEYLPNGEFRIDDPDGYCLMIAQSGPDTP
jgi:catechol 2,3-dioxygenase-like lactoylglutathione lyase family enzyme